MTALEHGGVVPRGYLGVNIQPMTHDMADSMGLKSDKARDCRRGDAGNAGGRGGAQGWRRDHQAQRPGGRGRGRSHPPDRVVQARRQGRTDLYAQRLGKDRRDHPCRPEERESGQGRRAQSEDKGAQLGIQIAPAKDVAGAGDKGVAIVGVDPNGTAAEQGLAAGNVILDVSGKPVSTPEDVKSGIATAKTQGKKAVLMRIQTADGARFVAVPFPKA